MNSQSMETTRMQATSSERLNGKLNSHGFERPRHWVGVEELNPEYWSNEKTLERRGQEFHDKPVETLAMIEKLDTKGLARREFLTLMGASMALASFSCARRPVHKIIPYVIQPEEIVSGVPNYYATTCPESGVGLLVKTREGRPIKVEGNPDHPMSLGATTARHQAAVLDCFDRDRLTDPMSGPRGMVTKTVRKWEEIDAELVKALGSSSKVRVLSNRMVSGTGRTMISDFLSNFASGEHVEWEPISGDDVIEGQELAYRSSVIPNFDFSKAKTLVSFGADFLGTWISPTEYSRAWSKRRKLEGGNRKQELSKLYVIESIMTVTGANADERISVRSGEEIWVALALAHEILVSRKLSKFAADPQVIQALQPFSGSRVAAATGISDLTKRVSEMADRLWKSRGESLVVAGGISTKSEYSKGLQVVCALLNSALENEGKTVDGTARALTRVVSPLARLVKLVEELRSGQVDALIVVGANPVYHVPATMGFAAAMEKAKLVVSIADRMDETAVLSDVVLPESHFLEAWGDAELVKGVVSLQQPTLAPIHNSRSYGEIFLSWSKALPKTSTKFQEVGTYYEVLRAQWKSKVHPETKSGISFEAFWEKSLRDGLALMPSARSARATVRTFQTSALSVLPRAITERKGDFSLTIYPKVGLYDGRQANNPWLQEFPDPISTATWDNYVNVGPEDAKRLNLAADDVVEVQNEKGAKLELPVLIQPGLRFGTISIAMGYGRTAAGRIGTGVGADVGPMVEFGAQGLIWAGIPVKLRKTGRRYQVAITQWHHVSENRPIVNDITLGDYLTDPAMANHTDPHLRLDPVPTMWPKFEYKNYKWSMAIDLNSCTGCGACVVGCQAENNIPVVGRDNVRVSREMHWIRIDRYYSGDENQPNVVFSPMLCQHCDNAPCETVCPVVATVHNNEGLNEQVYNRCVGTRYCQNNCPYKVRRFNFFDHWKSYEGSMNLSWNPDITVRSRGIMEKCTFCVHKIMDAKSKAKDEGRRVKDGDFQTACQQACPTEAIVFGDINDSESRVNRLAKDPRAYRVLEVLNTKPAISYLTKVRNQEGTTLHHPKGGHHGESEKGHG